MSDQKEKQAKKKAAYRAVKKIRSNKAKTFAIKVASGMAPDDAVVESGYKDGKYVQIQSTRLMKNEQVLEAIRALTADRIYGMVEKGYEVLDEALENGSRKERMDAAKEVFKIGSVYAPTKHISKQITEKQIQQKYKLPGED